MRLPVPGLALFAAVVGCLASGTFALGWYFVAKRTSPRVLGRHLVLNLSDAESVAVGGVCCYTLLYVFTSVKRRMILCLLRYLKRGMA